MKTKSKKTTTFAKAGKEFSKDVINLRMLGSAFILLRGLTTLKVLIILRLGKFGTNSNPPIITAIKSIQFHGSLKYDFLWIIKPIAMILRRHSIKKTTVHPQPIF